VTDELLHLDPGSRQFKLNCEGRGHSVRTSECFVFCPRSSNSPPTQINTHPTAGCQVQTALSYYNRICREEHCTEVADFYQSAAWLD
jgi:hypothetical protein